MAKVESRSKQLAYSDIESRMLDEAHRRGKANKIISVIDDVLGTRHLDGLTILDLGCSTGFIAHEIASTWANVIAIDIDEPGIERAKARFGDSVDFRLADGSEIPLDNDSVDIVIFNQIYRHVVDPEAVVQEIYRVLKPGGFAYLGVGNRKRLMEPHYNLPFLSWLPQKAADKYMQLTKKGTEYYEQFRTRKQLLELFKEFNLWDYTLPVLKYPAAFASSGTGVLLISKLPTLALRLLMPIVPTYLWIGFKGPGEPVGNKAELKPRKIAPAGSALT